MKIKVNPVCRDCGVELNDENWYPSQQKRNNRICKRCQKKQAMQWQKANPEKTKANWARNSRKQGQRPMNENRECTAFLGVYIAEEVLSSTFKNVQRMPYGHPGFDFICGGGYKIDVKSSCLNKNSRWMFTIKCNTIADYFLCLAFDSREDLNPLYIWLIPGDRVSNLKSASINSFTIHKWDEYQVDISKVITCCNAMRSSEKRIIPKGLYTVTT